MKAYCTPADISTFLRLINTKTNQRLVFSENTDPLLSEVQDRINSVSLDISKRLNLVNGEQVNEELIDVYPDYKDSRLRPLSAVCTKTHLKEIDFEAGDYIHIYNLNTRDFEPLDPSKYWIDYQAGIIYLDKSPGRIKNALKVKYRYGLNTDEEYFNSQLKEIVIKLVAAWYIESDFYKVGLPYGGNTNPPYLTMDKATKFTKEAMETLRSLSCPQLVNFRL